MKFQWEVEVDNRSGDVHVLPIGDYRDHKLNVNCRCDPLLRACSHRLSIVHNAYDGREFFEFTKEELKGCFHREVQA
jgi:hypothetical protein